MYQQHISGGKCPSTAETFAIICISRYPCRRLRIIQLTSCRVQVPSTCIGSAMLRLLTLALWPLFAMAAAQLLLVAAALVEWLVAGRRAADSSGVSIQSLDETSVPRRRTLRASLMKAHILLAGRL